MRRIGPLLSARLRPAPRAAWDYPAPRAACGFSVDASKAAPAHTPPLVVRASLVCGATALATPLFPIIGLNQLCFRYLDVQTRMVLTGGSSLAYFSAAVLAPEAFRYAPLLLPFAVGNGLTAAALYTAADVFAGGPDALAGLRIGPLPAAGALLGAATALIVPWTYPACWAWCIEGVATMGDADLYRAIHTLCYDRAGGAAVALPCLFVTGGVAGAALHAVLVKSVVGVPGIAWQTLAGAILAASALGLYALYSSGLRSGVEHLSQIDEAPRAASAWDWLLRRRAPCYIAGVQEALWTPALTSTGDAASELRTDGAVFQRLDGGRRAEAAAALALKAQSTSVRVYPSQRGALFDMVTLFEPLDPEALRHARNQLRPFEALMADALAAVVIDRVPLDELVESLEKTLPVANAGHGVRDVVNALLGVPAARLRELFRLCSSADADSTPPHRSASELRRALEASHVSVDRALKALAAACFNIDELQSRRDAELLDGHARQERAQRLRRRGVLLFLAAVVLGALQCAVAS